MTYKIIKVRRMSLNKKQEKARQELKKLLRIPLYIKLISSIRFWDYFFKTYYFLYAHGKIISCLCVKENIIYGFAVFPEYQKKGYGKILLTHALNDLEAQGRRNILLSCNNHLRTYYEKFGFKEKRHFIQMQK